MRGIVKAVVLAVVMVTAPMTAAQADNDIGCGVGTMIWEGNTGLPYKLLASWTNGITFQSISVTFGLLNCNGRNTVTASARTRHFVSTSFDELARDAALGGGERLDALAALLEVPATERETFARLAQTHFEELFPNDRVTSDEMLDALDRLMREDARLAAYVRG